MVLHPFTQRANPNLFQAEFPGHDDTEGETTPIFCGHSTSRFHFSVNVPPRSIQNCQRPRDAIMARFAAAARA
jgi:hypothetical protein